MEEGASASSRGLCKARLYSTSFHIDVPAQGWPLGHVLLGGLRVGSEEYAVEARRLAHTVRKIRERRNAGLKGVLRKRGAPDTMCCLRAANALACGQFLKDTIGTASPNSPKAFGDSKLHEYKV